MTAPVAIEHPATGNVAQVTRFGQLVVAPLDYSAPVEDTIDVIDTAFNFIAPEDRKSIVITDILLNATRSAPVNGALVQVYQAVSATAITVLQQILKSDMPRQVNRDLVGLNLIVPEGRWVNVQSDGVDIEVTLMFYRVPTKV